MQIVVVDKGNEWEVLNTADTGIEWIKAGAPFSFTDHPGAAAFLLLDENPEYDLTGTTKPVFINSVIKTLQQLNAPSNVLRINGWSGFLQRPVWEIAGSPDDNSRLILEKMNKRISPVKDEPGFIAARIIAMIINEAYFALGDAVSTKADIDTAMKLGTNYPYGPFEWAEKIGIKNIFLLLQQLTITDTRYLPAPALAATQNNS
ncbi:3-hydroxyacyl-CoA dehydrogenase family protein [Ferruginibacter sp.]